MEKVIGNCGKHPGQNMVNCPLCAIEKQQKLAEKIFGKKYNAVAYANYWHIQDSPFYGGKDWLNAEDVGEKQAEETAKRIENLLNETPSPTGDRDFEELKEEVERLQNVEIELEKKTKSSKEWCEKAMEAAKHRQELQSRISELEEGLRKIKVHFGDGGNNPYLKPVVEQAKQLLNKHP